MAWREPDGEDFAAAINAVELEEFNTLPEFKSHADPTKRIMADAAEFVRGYCRRLENKGGIKVCPTEGTVPASLMSVTMDIAAFRLLKRFNLTITDARQKAFDAALEVLRDVAEEKMIPESFVDEEAEEEAAAGIVPLYGMDFNPHTLCPQDADDEV